MLAPAQLLSGMGSNCPSNLGFLAYNYYTQIAWYRAVRNKQLHALAMLPVHFNIVYFFTYWGGVTSGNIYLGVLQGLGTAGVLILNTVSAWESWASNLEEGYGSYQFFFVGWRTLTPGWRKESSFSVGRLAIACLRWLVWLLILCCRLLRSRRSGTGRWSGGISILLFRRGLLLCCCFAGR